MPHFIFNSQQGVRNTPIKPAETQEQARSHCLRLQAACSQHKGTGHFPHPWEVGTTNQVFGNNPVMVCAFYWNISPLRANVPRGSELHNPAVLSVFNSISVSHTRAEQAPAWQVRHPQGGSAGPRGASVVVIRACPPVTV